MPSGERNEVMDEEVRIGELSELKQTADSIWRNQGMSTQAVASELLNLITKYVAESIADKSEL